MRILFVLAAFAVGSPLVFASNSASNFLNLDLRQDRYLGGVQHSTQQSNYTQMAAHLNLVPSKTRSTTYKLDARGQGTFETREESYFGIPEAYVGYDQAPVKVSLGLRGISLQQRLRL